MAYCRDMGGVYLTTEECTEPSGYVYRSSEKDFYTQIIADLKEAVAKLPVSTSDYGRATKGAAEAFLARVYLYNKNYEEALKYARNVINNYGYSLAEELFGPL